MANLVGCKIALRNIPAQMCHLHGVNNGDVFEVFEELDNLQVHITLRNGRAALVHPNCYILLDNEEIDVESLLALI